MLSYSAFQTPKHIITTEAYTVVLKGQVIDIPHSTEGSSHRQSKLYKQNVFKTIVDINELRYNVNRNKKLISIIPLFMYNSALVRLFDLCWVQYTSGWPSIDSCNDHQNLGASPAADSAETATAVLLHNSGQSPATQYVKYLLDP